MTDWDRYLPQVMGDYNSTQHPTTGISPYMMVTGHEKAGHEYDGKKKLPQVYVKDIIRCQQELIDYVDAIRNQLRRGRRKDWIRKQLVQKLTQ